MITKDQLRQHLLAAADKRDDEAFNEVFSAICYALELAAESGTTKAQERTLDRLEKVAIEVARFWDGYAEKPRGEG